MRVRILAYASHSPVGGPMVGGSFRSLLVALALALSVAVTGVGCVGCPAALLEGTLTRQDGDLVVSGNGYSERVDWAASHHRVRDDGGTLVVVDWLGIVKAREGDFVRLGGGESAPGVWGLCGMFEVGRPPN